MIKGPGTLTTSRAHETHYVKLVRRDKGTKTDGTGKTAGSRSILRNVAGAEEQEAQASV